MKLSTYLLALSSLVLAALAAITYYEEKPSSPTPLIETHRIEHLKKVFLHTPGEYSIMYQGSNSNNELILTKVRDLPYIAERSAHSDLVKIPTRILNDAPAGEMYLTIEFYNPYYFQVNIHVDTPDAVTGSQFQYREGKFEKTGYTDDIR